MSVPPTRPLTTLATRLRSTFFAAVHPSKAAPSAPISHRARLESTKNPRPGAPFHCQLRRRFAGRAARGEPRCCERTPSRFSRGRHSEKQVNKMGRQTTRPQKMHKVEKGGTNAREGSASLRDPRLPRLCRRSVVLARVVI